MKMKRLIIETMPGENDRENFDSISFLSMNDIDEKQMAAVLKHLKCRQSWEDIIGTYVRWADVYKHDRYQNLSVQEVKKISAVWEFTSPKISTCRNQFVNFLSKHKDFYNDDLDVVIYRMRQARDELSQQYGYSCQYLNWFPEYGGLVQNPEKIRNRELDWRLNNNLFNYPVHYEVMPSNVLPNEPTIPLANSDPNA